MTILFSYFHIKIVLIQTFYINIIQFQFQMNDKKKIPDKKMMKSEIY